MNRWEAWALHLSTILLTITGAAYALMRYCMEPLDPFSVIHHPLEPYMMPIHLLTAPGLILLFGLIAHSHIFFKYQNQSRIARRSGLSLIPLFVGMTASGYLLQIVHQQTGRNVLIILHLATGILWFFAYVAHYVASLRFRRNLARSAVNGNGPNAQFHASNHIKQKAHNPAS